MSQLTQDQFAQIESLIESGFIEDVGPGDISALSTIPKDATATGRFLVKADGVVAGLSVAEMVFMKIDPTIKVSWERKEGEFVKAGTYIGTVQGSAYSLLVAERLALNIMQRMGGVATATRQMVLAVGKSKTKILDTRKTAPGMRVLDKMAVKIGGGENHRMGLFDMVMIKDNHIEVAGGIRPAVTAVKKFLEEKNLLGQIPIEVETRTLEEVKEALSVTDVKIDRLMLDNMVKVSRKPNGQLHVDTSMLQAALKLINNRIPTEASGNVTLETVPAIAATGVTYISSGSLTHSVTALDISLKLKVHVAPKAKL